MAVRYWEAGVAFVFGPPSTPDDYVRGGVRFWHRYDLETGLRRQVTGHFSESAACAAYNAKIAELIRLHGQPPWSDRDYMLDDRELASYLDSPDLKRISQLPCEIAEDFVLVGPGEYTRWGRTTKGTGLRFVSPGDGARASTLRADDPIFVGRSGSHPRAVIFRVGRQRVSVLDEHGTVISVAEREEAGGGERGHP
jgi:hypothetical protein